MQQLQLNPRSARFGRMAIFIVAAIAATGAAVLVSLFAHSSSAASPNAALPAQPRTAQEAVATAVAALPAGSQAVGVIGDTKLYASSTAGTSCLNTVQSSGVAGSTCGSTTQQQAHGLLDVSITPGSPVLIAVIPPTGAKSVVVTDKDGTKKPVSITNGVAAAQDSSPASVSYVMASGSTQTEEIPAHIIEEHTPPPPSSETH